jgi:hypothetical protein
MAPAGRGLVEGDPGHVGMVGAVAGLFDVVMKHPPQPGIVLADQAGDRGDRHRGYHHHDQGLEQQGEAAAVACPGHRDPLDPAPAARHPWHAGMQVGFVLEEVEMPPGHRLGVIGGTIGRAAGRAGEAAASREIQIDVEALGRRIEAAPRHRPGRLQPQRHLKQVLVLHRRLPLPGAPIAAEPAAVLAAVKGQVAARAAMACGHP